MAPEDSCTSSGRPGSRTSTPAKNNLGWDAQQQSHNLHSKSKKTCRTFSQHFLNISHIFPTFLFGSPYAEPTCDPAKGAPETTMQRWQLRSGRSKPIAPRCRAENCVGVRRYASHLATYIYISNIYEIKKHVI